MRAWGNLTDKIEPFPLNSIMILCRTGWSRTKTEYYDWERENYGNKSCCKLTQHIFSLGRIMDVLHVYNACPS